MSITAIVTRHHRLFSLTSNSTDEIISHFKLQPAEKVELVYSPKNGDVFDTAISNWELSTLTRTSCLPKWFWRTQAVKQMHELLLQRHALGYYISDSPSVITIDNSETYHLRNTDLLLKNGHVHLHGHCSVLATGNTTVTIHGSHNTVIANNSVQAITGSIRDNNTVVLNNKSVLSMTDLFESKSIITCQNVIILANDESLIEDYRFTSTGPTSPTIMLRGHSKIKIYNRLEKS